MTFTRLTVVGIARRVDLVVPDDEPFAALLPDILDLLDEPASFDGAAVRLVRRTGEQLELAGTPAELAVPNGEVLRLVRAEDAPPPPEVADVTDVVAESLDRRADRWDARARRWTGAAAVASATALVGLGGAVALDASAPAVFGAGWAVALVVAVVFGRLGWTWTRMWATAVAVGVSLPFAVSISLATAGVVPETLAGAILVWGALGLGFGVAAKASAPAWAGLVGTGAAALWLGLSFAPMPSPAVPALIGIAGLVGIGILPSLALAASGLSKLDDAAVAGALPPRRAVASSLEEAYASLAWLGAALTLTTAAAGVTLALAGELYSLLLAVAIALVLALRTRQFPLVLHVVPLWIAAVAVTVAIAASPLLPAAAGGGILGVVAIVGIVLVGAAPSRHARVRMRRWGNLLELIAVVATVPLLLGVLGVYPDLLQVFP